MNSSELTKAIKFLKPEAEFSFQNADYSTIKWDILDGVAPTLEQLEDALLKLKSAEEAAIAEASAKRQALLDKLGITEDEARLLLGGN